MKNTALFVLLVLLFVSCRGTKVHCSNPQYFYLYITSGELRYIDPPEHDSSNTDSIAVVSKYLLGSSFTTLIRTDSFKVAPFVKQKFLRLSDVIPDAFNGDYQITLHPSGKQYKLTDITVHPKTKRVTNYEAGSSDGYCTNGSSITVNDSVYNYEWYNGINAGYAIFWVKY